MDPDKRAPQEIHTDSPDSICYTRLSTTSATQKTSMNGVRNLCFLGKIRADSHKIYADSYKTYAEIVISRPIFDKICLA